MGERTEVRQKRRDGGGAACLVMVCVPPGALLLVSHIYVIEVVTEGKGSTLKNNSAGQERPPF